MIKPKISLDVKKIRKDFPIFKQKINGKRLVYLDSAASTQKPLQVINAVKEHYETANANIHRGLHTLSDSATKKYEDSRKKVATFIGAKNKEIIFVRNATEAINLVAYTYGRKIVEKGDIIVTTEMEHHSNLIPWQILAKEKGAKLEYIPLTKNLELDLKAAKELLNKKPKILAITHVSNVLGTINPIKEIIKIAHDSDTKVLVDAAQSVPHIWVNVKYLDADFLVFSGHKMLGPSGIGVLYAKEELLNEMKPFLYGGDMIKEVDYNDASWNDLPYKFEAGTPNIEGAIGLGTAVDYLQKIGIDNIKNHTKEIVDYALTKLRGIKNVKLYGPKNRVGVIAFNLGDIHSHDIATVLDQYGVAVRSGHMCAQPLVEKYCDGAIVRASFYLYNTKDDVDALVTALEKARRTFKL